ncbi:cytochrome P450 [Micromonospora echinofusca]|uniref:cytochrome P450 n=1 Tax=Micromonospora echinofusca TaxID=47858 RepID=UPI0027DE32C0|nr:cytochrome P450 [Micromonospora echinofusca]
MPESVGRRRDRRVYLGSHPVLFALLAATRRWPVRRWGRTVLVHGTQAYQDTLTRVPLDRRAGTTTGGTAQRLGGSRLLFDEDGAGHRDSRRALVDTLGSAGVARLRPVWTAVLAERLAPLATGGTVDLVRVAAELAGATTVALLGSTADPVGLAAAARRVAATAAAEQLPGLRRPGQRRAARAAAGELTALLGVPADEVGRAAMLAVAAVNTTVAAIPRCVAWCADDRLWNAADTDDSREVLVNELLRVTAPSPLLPRVAAAEGSADGCPVRAGDRLLLVARHAAQAHRQGPDCAAPAPPKVAQLVFGAGGHACPGARLARVQLADTLAALAPYRPVVVRSRVDRRAGLPGWAELTVRGTT